MNRAARQLEAQVVVEIGKWFSDAQEDAIQDVSTTMSTTPAAEDSHGTKFRTRGLYHCNIFKRKDVDQLIMLRRYTTCLEQYLDSIIINRDREGRRTGN